MAYQVVLKLENVTTSKGFAVRATILHNPEVDFVVKDIMESSSIDTLRDAVKQNAPEVRYYVGHDGLYYYGGWSEALKEAKSVALRAALADGADVLANMSLPRLVEAHEAHLLAVEVAAERASDERQEREQRAAMREGLKNDRADLEAWAAIARNDKELRPLYTAVMDARRTVEGWPELLAEHVRKLQETPTYTLSWSGPFVEASAEYEVSRAFLDQFEAGNLPEDILSW